MTIDGLRQRILALRPAAVEGRDFAIVEEDGAVRIFDWSPVLGPRPSDEELAALTSQQLQMAQLVRSTEAATLATMTGMEPGNVSDRVFLRYLADELNAIRRHVGMPPILEPQRIADITAAAQAGYGAPVTPPG